MSTSFGIQAAVLLHMTVRIKPDVRVVWVDTGYLPAETYRYAETLTRDLQLDVAVVQSEMSPARMEALYGRLWASVSRDDLDLYDRLRKVEPMKRAFRELGATAWVAGVRAEQTSHRRSLSRVMRQWGILKVHPLLHWTAGDVDRYLAEHDLPRHPLEARGFRTVGDHHSSRPTTVDDRDERATRFRGVKQECGLHLEVEGPPLFTY